MGVNSDTAKRVLAYLIRNQRMCEEETRNYIQKIKEEVNLTRPTIQEALDELEELGCIEERKRVGQKKVVFVSSHTMQKASISEGQQLKNRFVKS